MTIHGRRRLTLHAGTDGAPAAEVRQTVTVRESTLITGRYELRALLGRGAMAEVWECYDQILERPVAVKFIRRAGLPVDSDYEKVVERFSREARVTAKLEHPGVPSVYDLGTHDGEAFLAMQLVTGHNLGDLMTQRGRMPAGWAAAIGAQICSVLAAAHAAALVHRDLKPRNLMLSPDGSVKVLDFGIAAVLDAVDLAKLTTTGHLLGTPTYMSPEQAAGSKVGPAADLYALGCVLHELLAGSPPFVAEQPVALLGKHLYAEPPQLTSVRADVPPALADLVQQLLAKDPQQRPADAAEVYRRLLAQVADAAADQPPEADLGPTRPYHYPLGPLPLPQVPTSADDPAATLLDVPAQSLDAHESNRVLAELDRAREQAVLLVDDRQLAQAGQLLAGAVHAASEALHANNPDILDTRLALAHIYLLAGDHQRALPELRRLAPALAQLYGPDHEVVGETKRSIVGCHMALGELVEARAALQTLLTEQLQRGAPDDPELMDLRAGLRRLEGGQP